MAVQVTRFYSVKEAEKLIIFGAQSMLNHTSFIDGFILNRVLIEQKVINKDLNIVLVKFDLQNTL